MKNIKKNINPFLPIILSVVLVVGILLGFALNKGKVHERLLIYPKNDKLNNVLNYIEQEYVDSVSKDKIIEEVIPVIMEKLDPHSVYIPAKDLQQYNEPLKGNFSGIGVQFNMQNDTVIIINTIANGPSEMVGILPGDRIITVNTDTVAGVNMPTDSIVSKLRGRKGTTVEVGIYRKGTDDLIYFEITRDNIPLYSVDVAYMISDSTGYIKISKFSQTTFSEFINAIDSLNLKGFNSLILDLRANGGGYMDAAIHIADQFLKDKKLIVYTEGRANPRKNFYATSRGTCEDKKVTILIDEWSASASEILAGAIQDNDRGTIIGRRSFGKGLVQEQTQFADGSAVRLTIARYYTPTGRSIQRPYDNGKSDYYNDISDRFEHGEFHQKDSIALNDSLKYFTPEGKIVYGGGGIMPDIFVPLDTSNVTPYLIKVRNKGLIYRFAFQYTDNNRDVISNYPDYSELLKYLETQDLLSQFIAFAENRGVHKNYSDIQISSEIIETQLHANIIRNIFDNDGYYPVIKKIDNTLLRAIEEIEK